MQFIADLHLHSTASDGEFAPADLITQAAARGLRAAALTDHDTLDGLAEAARAAASSSMEFIPGCEVTAYERGMEFHVLGLFLDPSQNTPLAAHLKKVELERPQRLLEMGAKLRSLGVPVTDEQIVQEASTSRSPGRAHVAAALVRHGHVKNMDEVFVRYLHTGGPAYVATEFATPAEAIGLIHDSGGIAILAHPGMYRRDEQLAGFFAAGLDGLEVYHHSHSPQASAHYRAICEQAKVCMSGGSDFHGPRIKPGVDLVQNGVTAEMLAALRARAQARRSR